MPLHVQAEEMFVAIAARVDRLVKKLCYRRGDTGFDPQWRVDTTSIENIWMHVHTPSAVSMVISVDMCAT
jgi:hypothetical protein